MIITKEFPKTCTAHFVQNAFSKRCSGPDLHKFAEYSHTDKDLKTNIHGHNYRWLLSIEADVDPRTGMVVDFGEFGDIKRKLDVFDHAFVLWSESPEVFVDFMVHHVDRLVVMKKNSTAENMAALMFKIADDFVTEYNKINGTNCRVISTTVYETDTGSATATSCDNDDVLVGCHDNSY